MLIQIITPLVMRSKNIFLAASLDRDNKTSFTVKNSSSLYIPFIMKLSRVYHKTFGN